jgi:hypothetical protein
MVRPGAAVVGVVSIGTGLVAVFLPDEMYRLWPPRRDSHLRLMQAWGIGSVGLGMALCGASVNTATTAVACVSIVWDLCWVPEPRSEWPPHRAGAGKSMGKIAASVNLFYIVILFLDSKFK